MNLHEGRIGMGEGVSALSIALTVSALFAHESLDAYTNGNSTYVSIPLSIGMSLLVFLLVVCAIKRSNTGDFLSMLKYGTGNIGKYLITTVVIAFLVLCASLPINKFMNLLLSYFFADANYFALAAFILPVIVLFAWMGLETIGRTAKVFGILFIIMQALLLINSSYGFQTYKIAPIMGDGVKHMVEFSLSNTTLFVPALIVLLALTKSTQGLRFSKRYGVRASVLSIVFCFITLLALAFSFTYSDLAQMYSPLMRMSMITGHENYLLRFDKISVFVWLAGAFLCSAYYIYGATYMYSRAFLQKDNRPTACGMSLIAVTLAIGTHAGGHVLEDVLRFLFKYGWIIICTPIIISAFLAIIKSSILENKGGLTDESNA